MALQDLRRAWLQKLSRLRTLKNTGGVPHRRCGECGHEVPGTGPEPTNCPSCGNRWRGREN
jgi:rubrerythrin